MKKTKQEEITDDVLKRLDFKPDGENEYEWYLVLPYGQGVELRFATVTEDLYLLQKEVKDGQFIGEKFIYIRDPKDAVDLELIVNALRG